MKSRQRWAMWILTAVLMILPCCISLASEKNGETFTVYAYCSCAKCCGKWSGGMTASGTKPTAGRTIAADWSVLKPGTVVEIEGVGVRTVEDRGVTGRSIDVFMGSHQEALQFGKHRLKIRILSGEEAVAAKSSTGNASGSTPTPTGKNTSTNGQKSVQIRALTDEEILESFELIDDPRIRLLEISLWRSQNNRWSKGE